MLTKAKGIRSAVLLLLAIYLLVMMLSTGCAQRQQDDVVSLDVWSLWEDGTLLRGANIYQRRVYPELDGDDFMGSGPTGPPYTREDLAALAGMGADFVVVSHPGLFTETSPYGLDVDMQANLDRLLEMIAAEGMYAVIAFRTGPGRSDFTFYWEEEGTWFDESYLDDRVWEDRSAQDAWVDMWRYTAQRYRGNPAVVGYELMVEPNSNDRLLDVWNPEEFYEEYGGTLYDWNQLFPRITYAIREVDGEIPVLVGGNGYSAVDWLPFVEPSGDPRTVYTVHQYAPHSYTHQDFDDEGYSYPGVFGMDGDGEDEAFDRAWLEDCIADAADFSRRHDVPIAVTEFGVVRWAPEAASFIRDSIALFEEEGWNHALWVWNPAWREWNREVDYFDFMHGPDPTHHADVQSSDLIEVIKGSWEKNRNSWVSQDLRPRQVPYRDRESAGTAVTAGRRLSTISGKVNLGQEI